MNDKYLLILVIFLLGIGGLFVYHNEKALDRKSITEREENQRASADTCLHDANQEFGRIIGVTNGSIPIVDSWLVKLKADKDACAASYGPLK